MHKDYYIVTDYMTYKNVTKPYFTLRNIKTGKEIKTKIKDSNIYKQSPFGLYDILKIETFTDSPKKKCINGDWMVTEELEPIVESFELIK
jgi:DNA polymerase-3 subunit alpha